MLMALQAVNMCYVYVATNYIKVSWFLMHFQKEIIECMFDL